MSAPYLDYFTSVTPGSTPDCSWEEALAGKKICILTFGCAYNAGDSEVLACVLKKKGSQIVDTPAGADVVIVNSCIVIASTERKMLKELSSYPDQEVWVTGCLPLARAGLLQDFPEVGIIYPDSIHEAAQKSPPQSSASVRVVQVGPGCTGSCRYCIIRLARGRIRSIPPEDIVSRIVQCERDGAAEIQLAGQDLSSYGMDTGLWTLDGLLSAVPLLHNSCRIRLGMMNPATLFPIAEKVARAMKSGPFFRFLHLPVQSGSDRVLAMMNRRYTVSDVLFILEIFRSEMPDITVATDVITGFPGESEEDHAETIRLLHHMRPGMVNVTRYSWRPGTGMGREDELPDRIRKDRSRAIIRDAYASLLKANEEKTGLVKTVLVTECQRPGSVMARTDSYEGVVIREEFLPGTVLSVKISGCTPHYLIGDVIRN